MKRKIDHVFCDGRKYNSVGEAAVSEGINNAYLGNSIYEHKPGEHFKIKGHQVFYTLANEKGESHKALLATEEKQAELDSVVQWADADKAIYDDIVHRLRQMQGMIEGLSSRVIKMEHIVLLLRKAIAETTV